MTQIQQLEAQKDAAQLRYFQTKNRFGANPAPHEMAEINDAATELSRASERHLRAKSDAGMMSAMHAIGDRLMGDGHATPGNGGSLGQQFVESDVMRYLRDSRNSRAGVWTSPSVELHATTLDESGGSGGPVVMPQYLPGILPLPQRPLVMSDLLAQGTTESNAIIYMREKTFTNASTTVAEGAAKPESALVFESITENVRKIAHWLPVTEEMLEDVAAMRSYIDQRLRLGVSLKEDEELLNGTNTPPDLVGFLNRTGLATAVARGADSNSDAIAKQIAAIFTATNLQPDGIVMHPTNWLGIQLAKNANGNYLGFGPWVPPQPASLWGLPVAVSPVIAAGTALVGCFQTAAMLFRRGGMRVEVSNSHSDFFIKNLVAVRAEERIALAVYRTAAFGTVTGLS